MRAAFSYSASTGATTGVTSFTHQRFPEGYHRASVGHRHEDQDDSSTTLDRQEGAAKRTLPASNMPRDVENIWMKTGPIIKAEDMNEVFRGPNLKTARGRKS